MISTKENIKINNQKMGEAQICKSKERGHKKVSSAGQTGCLNVSNMQAVTFLCLFCTITDISIK